MRVPGRKTALASLGVLAALDAVTAHTWVEQLMRIAPNGTMVGDPGFPPMVRLRSDPGFVENNLVTLMGRDGFNLWSKTTFTQEKPDQFPMLKAGPGDFVALRYQENGHVTLPQNNNDKPENRGTVYVYATSDPRKEDTLFDVHKKWTRDGKGGDGRGKLIATRNYDDGQCYQINSNQISAERQSSFKKIPAGPQGADLWCQSDIQLPLDMATDRPLAIYWIWDWPSLKTDPAVLAASKNGVFGVFPKGGSPVPEGAYLEDEKVTRAETYTSAVLINPVGVEPLNKVDKSRLSAADDKGGSAQVFNFIKDQDLNSAAVKAQLQNLFLVNVPNGKGDTPNPTITAAPKPTRPSGDVGEGDDDGADVVTVTVTAEPTTVTTMITVTVVRGGGAAPTNNPGNGRGGNPGNNRGGGDRERSRPTTVSAFLKARATGVRARTGWHFGV